MKSSYLVPAPRKVSKIGFKNSLDWFETSQAVVNNTTNSLRHSNQNYVSFDGTQSDHRDCHPSNMKDSILSMDKHFQDLSSPFRGNITVELERFYPEVLNFESQKIVDANGDIHTVMRTTTCESGSAQPSVIISKAKEPSISLIRKCLNNKPEVSHPGSNKYDSENAPNMKDFHRNKTDEEPFLPSSDPGASGDAGSISLSILVKETSPLPVNIRISKSVERGIDLVQSSVIYNRGFNWSQEVSDSTARARKSLVAASAKEHPNSFQSSSSEGMAELIAVPETEGRDLYEVNEHYRKQLKGSKIENHLVKSSFPSSPESDGVNSLSRSIDSARISYPTLFSALTKTNSEKSKPEEAVRKCPDCGGCEGFQNNTYDDEHLISTTERSSYIPPREVLMRIADSCLDTSRSASPLDHTAPETRWNTRSTKSSTSYLGPQSSLSACSNTRTTEASLARSEIFAAAKEASDSIENQQNLTPHERVPPSSSSFSFSLSSTSPSKTIDRGANMLFFLFLATFMLFSVCFMRGPSETSPPFPSQASGSPWIGQHNASVVISHRCLFLQLMFECYSYYFRLMH